MKTFKKTGLGLIAILAFGLASLTFMPKASAAVVHDWGWVQAYYGGVHVWMYDTCPDTPYKAGCREFHTDHHIAATNQIISDIQYLPEWVWPYSITPGQGGVGPALIVWTIWGAQLNNDLIWTTTDSYDCTPTARNPCGRPVDGMTWLNQNGVPQRFGGNTLHNRYVQVDDNIYQSVPGGYVLAARMILY